MMDQSEDCEEGFGRTYKGRVEVVFHVRIKGQGPLVPSLQEHSWIWLGGMNDSKRFSYEGIGVKFESVGLSFTLVWFS